MTDRHHVECQDREALGQSCKLVTRDESAGKTTINTPPYSPTDVVCDRFTLLAIVERDNMGSTRMTSWKSGSRWVCISRWVITRQLILLILRIWTKKCESVWTRSELTMNHPHMVHNSQSERPFV
ncbi:hypothetical protein ES288_A05G389300v1 [Gossypium darwinii]|nr:hypothetical protein ES288_A05G389300v1 [Gossypium darwinii]